MLTVRARVRNGRLIVDEPTDLPDGTEIDLTADDVVTWLAAVPPSDERLGAEDIQRLEAVRARADYTPHEVVRAKLAARKG